MEPGLIISFLGASILLSLMPGPDNIFVLTESVTRGHKTGIAISAGLMIGVLVHTTAAATGLSIIIQRSAIAFSVIKYFGVAYLLYLAFQASREQAAPVKFNMGDGAKAQQEFKLAPLLRKGFLMNVLNPKVSLFFIAFLPQFITPGGLHITWQMIILGLVFIVQAFIIFSSVALLSGQLRNYVNRPSFWNIAKWSKVGVLSILGFALALAKK